MAAKKAKRTKKPAQTMRAKKSGRATHAVAVRPAAVSVHAASVPVRTPAAMAPMIPASARSASVSARLTSPRAVLLWLATVAAVGFLIVMLQPSDRVDLPTIVAPLNAIALPTAIVPPVAIVPPAQSATPQIETKQPAAAKAPATTVARAAAADAASEKTIEPLKATPIEPASSSLATETAAHAGTDSTSKVAVETVASVTITGCLANDDDTFVLKDTSGADAPKSRSWKSGFLKKRAATIEILDASKALRLPNYVGQRVAATGMLVNHEMRAHSLRRVGSSCS